MLTPEVIRSESLRSFLTVFTGLEPKVLTTDELTNLSVSEFNSLIGKQCTIIIKVETTALKQLWYKDILNESTSAYFKPSYNIFTSNKSIFKLYYNRIIVIANKINDNDYIVDLNQVLHSSYILDYYAVSDRLKQYTNIPVREEAIRLAVSIDSNNILKQLTRLTLNDVIDYGTKIPDDEEKKLEKTINDLTLKLDEYAGEIIHCKQKIKELTGQLLYRKTEPSENKFSRFINFLNRCKQVKIINYNLNDSTAPQIQIITDWIPVDYTYADDRADKLILENQDFKDNPRKEILLDAITKRERYKIMHRPIEIFINTYETYIDFNIYSSPIESIDSSLFRNVHYFEYTCFGSFKSDFSLAKAEKDYIKLTSLLLQYIQTINIADVAGTRWLSCKHMIYDSLEHRYFIYNPRNGNTQPLYVDLSNFKPITKTQNLKVHRINKEYLE